MLPRLLVPVDRVDGEEPGREQLLALSPLRRDVVSRSAEDAVGAALVAMTTPAGSEELKGEADVLASSQVQPLEP
jgi:hypothetical protein